MTGSAQTDPTILYTGGTVGSVGNPLAPLPGLAFNQACRTAGLGGDARWEATDRTIDSADMTPSDWGMLAARIAAMPGPAVVLHGTDTLAWSAAALAYLLTEIDPDGTPASRRAAPVVITGSQRPLFGADGTPDPKSDAAANLEDALTLARGAGPGVHVAFGSSRLAAPRIVKVDTLADAAFAAPNGPGRSVPLPPCRPGALETQIAALRPHLGRRVVLPISPLPSPPGAMADALAGAAQALGERLGAVHIVGFGLGTVPDRASLAPVLAGLAARGVLIALSSQAHRGPVAPDLYAASSWLVECGAVPTADMTVPAVQAKLAVGLALGALHGWPREAGARFLARNIAGELGA